MYRDQEFMNVAMHSAMEGLQRGNIPVGAVLVIGGELTDRAHNSNAVNGDLNSHAEKIIIDRQSKRIYDSRQDKPAKLIELFTTWEPCLMCLGTSALNRINRIVYACPDPRGGTSKLRPEAVGPGYSKIWPEVTQDLTFREQSYDLLLQGMIAQSPRWETMVDAMREMRSTW